MRTMVPRVWVAACHEVSGIIYGIYLRWRLKPAFSKAPWERVTPYLFHSNQFSAKKKIVLWPAFSPSPKNQSKSVYWTSRLIGYFVWSIGQRHVAPFRGPLKGRADLETSSIYATPGLAIKLTSKPHPRHADIVGWDKDRRAMRLQAEKLADEATFLLVPSAVEVRPRDVQEDKIRLRVAGMTLVVLVLLVSGGIAILLELAAAFP